MKILTILLLFYAPLSMSAALSLSIISPPSHPSQCDGSITILADGSAGPFEIRVLRKKKVLYQIPNVLGEISINDLCGKDYEVIAVNRFGCEHYLGEVNFKNGNGNNNISSRFGLDTQSIDELETSVHPNPFGSYFNLQSDADYDGEISVAMLDNIGRELQLLRFFHQRGLNEYQIEVGALNLPDGLLTLEVRYLNSGVIRREKLLHVEAR